MALQQVEPAAAPAEAAAPPPKVAPAMDARVDPSPQSPFEGWLKQMRRVFSPLFYSTRADGSLERGLSALPLPDGPLLFVGNHQLYGFDGPMILEEMLRERGQLLRPLVFPPLLAETSPLAPFPCACAAHGYFTHALSRTQTPAHARTTREPRTHAHRSPWQIRCRALARPLSGSEPRP